MHERGLHLSSFLYSKTRRKSPSSITSSLFFFPLTDYYHHRHCLEHLRERRKKISSIQNELFVVEWVSVNVCSLMPACSHQFFCLAPWTPFLNQSIHWWCNITSPLLKVYFSYFRHKVIDQSGKIRGRGISFIHSSLYSRRAIHALASLRNWLKNLWSLS